MPIDPAFLAALHDWLATPIADRRDDELALKLAAAARLGERTLREVIERERRRSVNELRALHRLSRSAQDPVAELLAEGALLQIDAQVRLLDLASRSVGRLTAPPGLASAG